MIKSRRHWRLSPTSLLAAAHRAATLTTTAAAASDAAAAAAAAATWLTAVESSAQPGRMGLQAGRMAWVYGVAA